MNITYLYFIKGIFTFQNNLHNKKISINNLNIQVGYSDDFYYYYLYNCNINKQNNLRHINNNSNSLYSLVCCCLKNHLHYNTHNAKRLTPPSSSGRSRAGANEKRAGYFQTINN